ncbi:hypothetical protein ACHAWF_014060 [Thalassiosira exigua]
MTTSHQDESGGAAAAPSHPGTSGRSPPPPRGAGAAGAGPGVSGVRSGRPSVGSAAPSSAGVAPPPSAAGAAAAAGGGRPSLDPSVHPGRLSYGSFLHGTRLSYGSGSAAAGGDGGGGGGGGGGMMPPPLMTPIHYQPSVTGASPPSTTSTGDVDDPRARSEFFAALSPSTARFLRGPGPGGGHAGGGAAGATAAGLPSPASRAAASAVRTAANAARGIHGDAGADGRGGGEGGFDDGNDDDNDNDEPEQRRRRPTSRAAAAGPRSETDELRSFVQSLLGMRLPASSASAPTAATTMTTPDPAAASFFATSLLAQTAVARGGRTVYRPDDAYLAARALSLRGEDKRAVWILDRAGLVGFGMGGDAGGGAGSSERPEDGAHRATRPDDDVAGDGPEISDEEGTRHALLLRAEAALLAGQCLSRAGEHERAAAVYEEAMRFPPPPPPPEWGAFGYGYGCGRGRRGGELGADPAAADEAHLRSWRERSLSHAALIDDGDDERLLHLAAHVRPLPFSDEARADGDRNAAAEGVHPVARLCAARGIAYDEASNPHRAVPFLRTALGIDARCVEALDHAVERRLLTPEEEREWIGALEFGREGGPGGAGSAGWLRDAYLARARGGTGGVASPSPTASRRDAGGSADGADGGILGESPVPRSDLQSPSMLSLGSPDFAGGAVGGGGGKAPDLSAPEGSSPRRPSRTVDDAFRNLALRHNLGRSPDVLSHAAIRSYASHDLRSALAYCTALDAVDPYCRAAGYVHVATLVGLRLKRRLFQLAHRLVDADPKDALAWFAVGSYYYACGRYDLAQRHFSRSTRLDPGRAEGWIGFGCSFAVCDESDQALASFRAAQGKHAGSHVPLLYMGMEYLRTNHLSLAGHFLTSAQRVDPSDALCCNELGVWSFRQGDMEDAAFWFVKALRLHVRAEVSALTSTDEALGMNGFILLSNAQCEEEDDACRIVAAASRQETSTPYVKRQLSDGNPPMSTVLCAMKTPSGNSIAASVFTDTVDCGLTDTECIERCNDQFWEPTIFNLGQSYRKTNRYADAIVCFEKCSSLNPSNYAAYAALGFAKHLSGDVDGAIDSYHEALSRKPEDPFTSEMLTRALAEAVTYPPSLAMLSPLSPEEDDLRKGGVGSSILKSLESSGNSRNGDPTSNYGHGSSMLTADSNDIDMSLS